jgi:zinc D-Ala-D-Ala dipeptidase
MLSHQSSRRFAATVGLLLAVSALLVAQTQAPSWPREPDLPNAPRPSAPEGRLLPLIGIYETKAAPGETPKHAIVFEDEGQTWITIDRARARPFPAVGKDSYMTEPVRGQSRDRVIGLLIGADNYHRVQIGPGVDGQLRVTPIRNVAAVLKESLTVAPPAETGDFKPADLVEVAKLDPTIKLEIRYATTNNFLGSVFYAQARAFLQRPAAEAVLRAARALKPLGYGLLIHDGYRPWYVTRTFWECTPPEKKWLVANPASGSRHNRGAAVDLTLYDLDTGAVIEMPSTYDESTERAYAFYPGGTSLQRWHRALLRRVMEAEGFTVNPEEWWHFDYQDWKSYRIGNTAFDQIR